MGYFKEGSDTSVYRVRKDIIDGVYEEKMIVN